MNSVLLLGLIRHLLTFGGGVLTSSGYLDQSQSETAVGAVIAIVGVVWSAIEKKRRK